MSGSLPGTPGGKRAERFVELACELGPDGVAQDLHDLIGGLRGRHRGAVDLLQGVGELIFVERDDRLAQRGRVAGLERRVPLLVLVPEPHHHHVGLAKERLGAHRVDARALVVAPELLVLLAQDVRADVVGCRVIGDRREQGHREASGADAVGDPLAPVGVDLARQVDVAGSVAVRHSFAPLTTSGWMEIFTRCSAGWRNGYSSSSRYFFAIASMCSSAPSCVISSTWPRTITASYGLSGSVAASATRESLRTLRGLTRPSALFTTMR